VPVNSVLRWGWEIWQKFIKAHQEVFKVPALLFEDMELTTIFAKIVSESLSTICGNIKAKVHSTKL
jgi:hypothetical protein